MSRLLTSILLSSLSGWPLLLTVGCNSTGGGSGGGGGGRPCAIGADCDDRDTCTTDACVNNACQNKRIVGCLVKPCTEDLECDDGDPCNGAESCTGGSCEGAEPVECPNDGFFCDGTESCDPDTGDCVSSGDPCGAGETCDEDGDACTVEPVIRCADVTCDDNGTFCDGTESCDPDTGDCVSSGDPCGAGESCDPDTGDCVPSDPICTDDTDCDDGIFCNGTETCGFDGVCQNGDPPCNTEVACLEIGRRCEATRVLQIKYFEHAEVAEEQGASGKIPIILRENGASLILQMPSGQSIDGWVPGTVILVQDEDGMRLHKYVVYATQLTDGTVGVIAREATLLSAIDEATMVDTTEPNAKIMLARKVIIDGNFAFQRTIDLSDYNIELGDHATINWVNADIEFDFTTRARLEINSVILETFDAAAAWIEGKVSERVLELAALLDDGKIDSEEDMILLQQRLDNDEEFRDQVDDILEAMEDSERIKDAFVAIDGTLSGVFQPEFVLSASGGGDRVFPILPQDILVPLGPIPAQVSLNVSLVLGTDISGEVRLTTGMEFGVRLHAEADWQTRSATAYPTALDGWNGVFLRSIDPVIDADASFSVKAGVQPEIGLTLFQILGFTVNPEIYARLDAEATGSNDCVQFSYELLGGFDASVRGEALVVWQTNEWSFFNREWSLLGPDVWESSGCHLIPPVLTAPALASTFALMPPVGRRAAGFS